MEKIRIENQTSAGFLWAVGWLFTLGFLKLGLSKALLAIVLWPYYLGVTFSLIK